MPIPALAVPSILKAILAPLASLWRWLTAEPVRLAFAVLLLLCGVLCWRLAAVDGDRDKWRDRARAYEAASKAVKDAAKVADKVGTDTAATEKGKTDAVTEQARDDAAKSVDPLDAVSKRLRAEGAGRGGEATR